VAPESSDPPGNGKSTFWGNIMKKLSILASIALASTAFISTSASATCFFGCTPPPAPTETPAIVINGTSTQGVAAVFSAIRNRSEGSDSVASQSVSSNSGNVTVNGPSTQLTAMGLSDVSNYATGNDAVATQSMSSNIGKVTINGTSLQATALLGSYVANGSTGARSLAVQNVASNNGCATCN
jgi:hypothetical protein